MNEKRLTYLEYDRNFVLYRALIMIWVYLPPISMLAVIYRQVVYILYKARLSRGVTAAAVWQCLLPNNKIACLAGNGDTAKGVQVLVTRIGALR